MIQKFQDNQTTTRKKDFYKKEYSFFNCYFKITFGGVNSIIPQQHKNYFSK